jgi:hypothetical protein
MRLGRVETSMLYQVKQARRTKAFAKESGGSAVPADSGSSKPGQQTLIGGRDIVATCILDQVHGLIG